MRSLQFFSFFLRILVRIHCFVNYLLPLVVNEKLTEVSVVVTFHLPEENITHSANLAELLAFYNLCDAELFLAGKQQERKEEKSRSLSNCLVNMAFDTFVFRTPFRVPSGQPGRSVEEIPDSLLRPVSSVLDQKT